MAYCGRWAKLIFVEGNNLRHNRFIYVLKRYTVEALAKLLVKHRNIAQMQNRHTS